MKFKVGDKVRYSREAIIEMYKLNDLSYPYAFDGFEIIQISGEEVRSEDSHWFHETELELVPEECEFEYGEEIEVSNDGNSWYKKICISIVPLDVEKKYITIVKDDFEDFVKKGYNESLTSWKYARKLKPQLTRKEIAEKFGIDKDFIFVDG